MVVLTREHLEDQMAGVLFEITQCNAQIRAVEAMTKKRDELRQKLLDLATKYAATVAGQLEQPKTVCERPMAGDADGAGGR